MDKGDTFLMGVLKGRKKHLWVVISDPKKHNGIRLIVDLSTDPDRTGKECPILYGEHPWLTEPVSWLCYADAAPIPDNRWHLILAGIPSQFVIPERPMPTITLGKIIAGAKISASKTNGAFRKDYLPYLD
jgi:hypothetical protein